MCQAIWRVPMVRPPKNGEGSHSPSPQKRVQFNAHFEVTILCFALTWEGRWGIAFLAYKN